MKKGKLLATLLCSASMVMGSLVPTVPAMADAMKVVTLGADLSDEQKMDYADSFADRYGEDPIGFVAFMSKSAFAVSGSYRETWLFIKEGTNSLHRWSNLHLALPADSAEERLKDAEHL